MPVSEAAAANNGVPRRQSCGLANRWLASGVSRGTLRLAFLKIRGAEGWGEIMLHMLQPWGTGRISDEQKLMQTYQLQTMPGNCIVFYEVNSFSITQQRRCKKQETWKKPSLYCK
jgi:hypothetical protein